ncbi:DUF4381 family protein [Xanthomonas translucens]|uniref:DUF4381 family protein n=3 Tax=Xanthomonas campestris pv. translucens TaxID=343 RepID=UPI0002A7A5E9|nr:DUF4381 family protein [Xanthomonas translucens]AKK68692.1 hypothetical protein FD63_15045 [Xanthomonas translucens pv. undulosa]AVY65802.1 membrane protein [Xanthomonas translucens pv. undulosa]ELP95450.1 hypothetical protein A989_19538 [Xanthomonas translucens DAR61454]MBC3972688.1 DUF4381 domain-containing protein [Xanthomonas translucens pv. undulosa]MCT8269462.1 DUF4381 domain-containing protein [Xanthomonas translucens pv. undulosa]
MTPQQLPLRDVHLPPAPAWWPPAPGWLLLGASVLLALGIAFGLWAWRRARRRRWQRQFDAELGSGAAPAQVAAVSELLRRAARRRDPAAAALQGEAWLRFLDGGKRQDFSAGPGRVLLDGGYRRDLEHAQLQALLPLARRRFLELMGGRRR